MTEEVCVDLSQENKSPIEGKSPIKELLDEYLVEGYPSVRDYLSDKGAPRAAGFCMEHQEIFVPYAFELLDDEKRQYLYDMFLYGHIEFYIGNVFVNIRKLLEKGIPLEKCEILAHDLLEIQEKANRNISFDNELPKALSLFVKLCSKSVVLLASKINGNLE